MSATEVRYSLCSLCDASCGIEVWLRDGRVESIKGNREHVLSAGHICPKARALQDLQEDPDRIRQPMLRKGTDWYPVSWEEALDRVGSRIAAVQRKHGNDALAFYFGTPTGHAFEKVLGLLPFQASLKTRNVYSAGSVDSWPRMYSSMRIFGNMAALPVPDIHRTKYLLIIGANPVVSQGSIMTAPNIKKRLKAIRERGGKIVVIDPRRTETAQAADEHHFIRPGTDVLLLAAMLHTLFETNTEQPPEDLVSTRALNTLRKALPPFSPEAVAERVGIDAQTIRRLTHEFSKADGACAYGRIGTSIQEFGATATWLTDLLNILTGNLDRPGGTMFCTPAVDLARVAKLFRQTGKFDSYRSRTKHRPDFNGELPVAALTEELEAEGRGQIKALITLAGNPLRSLPGSERLTRAVENLEFQVAIDYYMNETTRHADVILPPTTPLESAHYPMLEFAMAVHNVTHYAQPVLTPPEGARGDAEIMLDISRAIRRHRGPLSNLGGAIVDWMLRLASPRRQLALLLRLGPRRLTLKQLEAAPHGIDLGPLEPRIDQILNTKTGRLSIVPSELLADLKRARRRIERPKDHGDALMLFGRRQTRSMNSWLHNLPSLMRGPHRCTLMMHPDDAERLGIEDGQTVTVTSRVGEIAVAAELTEDVAPGTVCLPHGWGHHDTGVRLSLAAQNAGINMNTLIDPSFCDPVSGTAAMNGMKVWIAPAPLTQDSTP